MINQNKLTKKLIPCRSYLVQKTEREKSNIINDTKNINKPSNNISLKKFSSEKS